MARKSKKKKEMTVDYSKLNSPEHQPKSFVRGNDVYFICDHCGKEVKGEDATKMSKGKNKDYAYCPTCTKELYPNYKKIAFQNMMNPGLKNIIHEACARKEYRK